MPVPTTLRGISGVAANNYPTGGETIGATLDDYLRGIQSAFRQFLAGQASNIASAATTDLTTADGFYVQITGTTTITGFGTEVAGIHYLLRFAAALTLTHNATSLILPGAANITTAAGDLCWIVSEGSGNWRVLFYTPVRAATNVANTDQTLTDGATINWDMNLGAIATITLGGNRTMAAPSNLRKGTYALHVIQDGTGSRTITWNSVFKWPSATAPTLSTGINKRDVLCFVCDGTNLYGPPAPWVDVR